MTTPAEYARSYAQMFTWFWNGGEWGVRRAPIINYLQNNGSAQAKRAAAAEAALRSALARVTKIPNVNNVKTFNYNDFDYINNSIRRCFIGKASPWEIQETLQLASEVGAVTEMKLLQYCAESLGVDCGGFVAAYWGIGCPHMVDPSPDGWTGILPRGFWSATSRRRQSVTEVKPGDAIIFFKDLKNNDPDVVKKKDSSGAWIKDSGSEAFHIGLVSEVDYAVDRFTRLEIAESSGAPSKFGGSGVNVRKSDIIATGKSGKWVHCQSGANTWLFFVAPPPGWGPETAYKIGEE